MKNSFITRISTRAKEVLGSFANQSRIDALAFLSKIDGVEGMGSQLIKSHPDILKGDSNKQVRLGEILEEAFFFAIKMGHTYVGTEHLLLAVLGKVGYERLELVTSEVERLNSLPVLLRNSESASKVPLLNSFGTDLTKKYMFYPKILIVEREEVDKILKVLLQKNDSNVLLLGEKGSGKRSITSVLARKVSFLDVPAYFVGSYVIDFNLPSFVASLTPSGESLEGAIRNLASEIKLLGRSFLVIRQLPGIFFGSFKHFVGMLNDAGAKVIICLEPEIYDKALSLSENMFCDFTAVEVKEPSQKIITAILKTEIRKLEDYFMLKIPADIADYVYKKAKTEIKDQPFPQKAVELLDKACALAAFDETKVPKKTRSTMEKHLDLSLQIEEAFLDKDYDKSTKLTKSIKKLESSIDGMTLFSARKLRRMGTGDVDKALEELQSEESKEYKIGTKTLNDLEKRIKQRVIGQDNAVEVVAKALVRSQMGLRPKNKPVGNFLFLGPTGVGKTELAKVLAQEAFGDDALIRLDMSDFSEKHTVSRLVGAPPGYIGYSEGGELTSKISQKPQSVVLFDEIEKAHPDVLNILLQIMEEGQLSDMKGEVFNFSHAVVILTSNLGTDAIHKRGIGYGGANKSQKDIEEGLRQSAKSFLKPELLNRFDEVVMFRQLDKADSAKILNLLLKEVYDSLADKSIKIKVGVLVKRFLLEKGFSAEFGARSLRRTVEKELLDKIAGFLLEKKAVTGKIKADLVKGVVTIG